MVNGDDYAVAAMRAAQTRLDVASENLANANSDGFHGEVVRFSAATAAPAVAQNEREGALRVTGRPFDLALIGPGAFRVSSRDGVRTLVENTRNGAFSRDRFGRLVDDRGRALLGADARPIVVDEATEVRPDGTFVSAGKMVGRIALAPGSRVQQHAVETSNVDGIGEMLSVIDAQRSFDTAQRLLKAADQAREKAVTETGVVRA